MRDNFDPCLTVLWNKYGDAELDDPHRLGARRLGITRKTLASWRGTTQSRIDLNELNKGEAAAILHVWFWRAVHADELPKGLDYAVFERAVMEGPKAAKTALQFAAGIRPTGKLSGRDIARIERMPLGPLLTKLGAAPEATLMAANNAA